MNTFSQKYGTFLLEFGKGRKMVLSTSENNRVSSRMMSVVQIDGICEEIGHPLQFVPFCDIFQECLQLSQCILSAGYMKMVFHTLKPLM